MTVKDVKSKSESFFSISHGFWSYGGNLRGADSPPPPPPAWIRLNKINFAKPEHLKSKKDSRVLPINLVCNVTGIVYKVEEFRKPNKVC